MDNITKLWPVNQLLDWLSKIETKFVRVKSNDLTVLIAILKFANNESLDCWPSIEKIARITLKSKIRVRDVIKRLIKLKILVSTERYSIEGDRDSNMYKYNPNMLWEVGAICSLPWITNVAHRRLQTLPLTTNTTNHVTKKHLASQKYNQKQTQPMASVTSQSTSSGNINQKRQEKGSPLFEKYINKNQ